MHAHNNRAVLVLPYETNVSYCVLCASIGEDNPRALANGLSSL